MWEEMSYNKFCFKTISERLRFETEETYEDYDFRNQYGLDIDYNDYNWEE